MAEQGSGSETKAPTAYIAFKTLMDIVERMQREEPPTRVDPSYLDNYAGGYRPTVISNLQGLGLLEKTGEPTGTLLALVEADESGRKHLIKDLISANYADVLALGKNSTQAQFLGAFDARGVRGDTRRKAVSFFLKACSYAGIQTGTHWKTPPASTTPGNRRVKATNDTPDKSANDGGGSPGGGEDGADQQHHGQDVAVVRLRSGGTLTLALQGNSLTMPKDDRTFVFGIVDKMQEYEQPPEPSDVTPDEDETDDDVT